MRPLPILAKFLLPGLAATLPGFALAELTPVEILLKLEPEGRSNAAAIEAVAQLSKVAPSELPTLFAAMNQANELAANYLRSAIDTVIDAALADSKPLPIESIEAFLDETHNHPRARRLAYEILSRVAPEKAARRLPSFSNDPSVELRYDAVEQLLQNAGRLEAAGNKTEATPLYRRALESARHQSQIDKTAAKLRALGEEVDLPRHFGFLTHWKVIGPFDNAALAGFETAYPPETEWKPEAEYDGKNGKVRWVDLATADEHGKVDLNPTLGELKEVTGYAFAHFNSPIEGRAEIRLGCKNGWKIWFNQQFIFGRDEYHRGARIDQYRLPVTLRKGPNTLLLKICQNADVKDWTREWEFQLRICDATGTAILASDRPPTPKPEPKGTPGKPARKG
jgi:hypothetical protein